ncbi:hypothetical protein BDP27DRAFT_1369473 [Rhodocollybia butyracea]|uniref:Uncharacterized protein n=1 Tax=Rhodocollybia butyracea TaxID=206335 RepID=A0A9P5U0R0_9AGAR|nr:hypothetical protein BDP27DRAFT_1369473 [Rhodocollybia butyracea]
MDELWGLSVWYPYPPSVKIVEDISKLFNSSSIIAVQISFTSSIASCTLFLNDREAQEEGENRHDPVGNSRDFLKFVPTVREVSSIRSPGPVFPFVPFPWNSVSVYLLTHYTLVISRHLRICTIENSDSVNSLNHSVFVMNGHDIYNGDGEYHKGITENIRIRY